MPGVTGHRADEPSRAARGRIAYWASYRINVHVDKETGGELRDVTLGGTGADVMPGDAGGAPAAALSARLIRVAQS